jgi:two-component system cell cycle response regulator
VEEHILVVDDSDIALRFMAGRLSRFGFVVHLARSGEEALARTQRQHFAFVFMDVTMPGLDGFATCKLIKRRDYPAGTEPPTIVMLTSRDTPIDKLRGTMAGCDAYLTKPLDENALLKIVGDREIRQHEFADTQKVTSDS